MDEGKYHRHVAKLSSSNAATGKVSKAEAPSANEADKLHAELNKARQQCGLNGEGPQCCKSR